MAFLANLRSTIAYQPSGATVSTGAIYTAASSGAAWSNALVSSMVSIGTSTNQTYTTLSQGNFTSTSNWVTTLTGRTSTIGVSMSANAQTQLVVSQVSIVSSIQFTSTLGQTWSSLSGATGLPSSLTTSYSAGAISGDGKYGIVGTLGGYVYTTANAGASWTNIQNLRAYLPFNGSVTDTTGATSPTVTGSVTYVPGIVGSNAVNLANTASSNPSNYIRGTLASIVSDSIIVSGWFNMQSYPPSGTFSVLWSFGTTSTTEATAPFQLQYFNNYAGFTAIILYVYSGAQYYVGYYPNVALNTWYNFQAVYLYGGKSYLYINNASAGNGREGLPITPVTTYVLGGSTNATPTNAFNGYIDDFKIYTGFYSLPQNWSSVALSNTGQYMLATATGTGLFLSSTYGSSWSQVTSTMLYAAWINTQVSATGQYLVANSPQIIVQPQLTYLEASTWQKGGITWTASASSAFPGAYYPYQAFDGTGYQWSSSKVYNSSGGYTGSFSTIVNGSIIIRGEYLQLQSVTPVQMYSYTFSGGEYLSYPNGYTIAGSNDGSTWYLLQTVAMSGNPTGTTTGASSSSYIIVNQSGAQTMTTTGGTATFTCTTSSYTTTPYSYFRIIIPAIFNNTGTTYTSLQEWLINFQTGGQTYSTNYGATWNTAFPLYSMIQPLQYGLASNTWNQNGVSWTASASVSNSAGQGPFNAFSGLYAIAWVGALNSYRNVSPYDYILTTYVTPIISVGTIYGDWLQIQSSGPLIMTSYTFASSGILQQPQTYYIVGSNDGTTWYPIQYATGTVNPLTASSTACSTYLSVSSSTTPVSQPIQGNVAGAYTTRGYSTSTGSYIYFRIIVTNTWGYTNGNTNIGQWFINFTSGIQTTQSLSPSGLTALTGYTAGTISPQQTGLSATTWNQAGVNWTASASGSLTAPDCPPFGAFNNYIGSTVPYSWCSINNVYAGTPAGTYNGTITTTVLGGIGAVPGEWLQLQSSVPLVMYSYTYACGGTHLNNGKTYYIVGSNDNIQWYPIQFASMTTNPNTVPLQRCTTYIIVNQSGTQTIIGGQTGSGTFTTYPASTTGSYTYFRIIGTSIYAASNFELGEWNINFTTPSNTSLYNIVSPLTNLLTGSSVTTGTIPGTIVGSAVSNTGQYMVVITNNTTGNNVYYSTNTGATFTGLQLGSLVMTSCAISYDGSYITVSNATTVYQLNNNSTGYTIAVGNQAGLQNQAQNAIAIGNYAGTINQTANSIILNASGQGLNSVAQGFYVAPIASYTASSSPYFSIMGYGLDNQVTHSNGAISMLSNGNIGIGVTTPSAALHARSSFLVDDVMIQFPPSAITNASNTLTGQYPGQYIVTSSSNRNETGEQYHVFDYNPTTFWQVTFPPTATTTASGSIYTGEWVQLQSPYLFTLTSYAVYSQSSAPTQWVIVGSTNGTTWTLLDSQVSQNILTLSTYTVQSSAYSYYRYIMMASGSITPALFTWNLYGNPQLIKSIGGATTIGGPLTALGGTTTIGGPLTALGGITNMGWTQVNYYGSNGYLSFPGPGGSVYYILSGTVRSSDTSYFYVYPPVPCYLTGYVVYGINTPSQPQAEAPLAAGYPTSTKFIYASFNLGGAQVGNSTTIIYYTVYCRT